MRSLTWKLILTFWLVSLLGLMLLGYFVTRTLRHDIGPQLRLGGQIETVTTYLETCYDYYDGWPTDSRCILVDDQIGLPWAVFTPQKDAIIYAYRLGKITSKTSIQPLEDHNGAIIGYLAYDAGFQSVGFGRSTPNNRTHRNHHDTAELFAKNVLYAGGAIALVSLLVGAVVTRNVTRPVRHLIDGTHAIAKGNLEHQVPVTSQDELGMLAQSFNKMSSDLAHSMQVRQQMTADIAHDLRTPVSVIMGHAEAVKDGVMDAEKTIHIIHDESIRLNRLIDDLRTLSLADAGELSMVARPSNLRDLIQRVQSAHQPQAHLKQVALEIDVAASLPEINIDPDRMAQVLDNLVSNALRYTEKGGSVQLSASRLENPPSAPMIRLTVSDTGMGIEPAHLANIFNRFYRADASRHGSSSGLGLAIAKSIVEQHGGTITAASTVGRGTTFIIELPSLHESHL